MLDHRPNGDSAREWLSAYLFFSGDLYSAACDRILLDSVAPFIGTIESTKRRWFFIRYGEGGCHIRLRLFGQPTWLAHEMWPAIERLAQASPNIDRVTFAEYEPEIDRYGGPHGVALAEKLFHHSSKIALALLRKTELGKTELGNRSALLGKAMLAMLILLHAFFGRRQEAASQADFYGRSYLRLQVPDVEQQARWLGSFEAGFDRQADQLAQYITAAWALLEAGDSLTEELDIYRARLQRVASSLSRLFEGGQLFAQGKVIRSWPPMQRQIASSYLHMMNNRLGVNIRDECYLAILISRVLNRSRVDSEDRDTLGERAGSHKGMAHE